jgi:AraC-like DNA-binding protein
MGRRQGLISRDAYLTFRDFSSAIARHMPKRQSGHLSRIGRVPVEGGMVRVGPIMALPEALESFSIAPAELLSEFGLEPSFFADPENTLPMAMAGRLLGRCAEQTGCEHFGLLVGQRAGASSLGVLGFLMQSSRTVGDALADFARHLEVQDRGGTVWVESEGALTTLGYTLLDAEIEFLDQIMACAFAIAANILRTLCGPEWRPSAVLFAFSQPRNVEPYRRHFGLRPHFDADRTGIVFPTRWLDRAIPGADILLHKLMEERVRELKLPIGDSVDARVRRLLRTMVTTPDCSAGEVADRMGMHIRTLNRELAAAGTTFLALREEARKELACQLLDGTRTTIREIATILGYTDAATLARAFRRWTGSTPSRWRANRRSGDPAGE